MRTCARVHLRVCAPLRVRAGARVPPWAETGDRVRHPSTPDRRYFLAQNAGAGLSLAPMAVFWLSFAPETGPSRVFLLDAADEVVARVKAHSMKLYRPGDQLLILPIPDDWPEAALPRDRELTEEELESVEAENLGSADA